MEEDKQSNKLGVATLNEDNTITAFTFWSI